MAFDLGYDPAIGAEPRLVEEMLKDLEDNFDLVMIMELMDESLVMLRRLMCWSTDDVTYLTKNARFESRHTELTAEQRASLEEYLSLDVTLYRHFRQRLVEQVAAVPLETFLAQAEALVARRLFWRQHCVVDTVKGTELEGDQHEITDKVQGYQLSDKGEWMCSRLGIAELGYTDLVRDAQRERLAVWHRLYPLLGIDPKALAQPGDGG